MGWDARAAHAAWNARMTLERAVAARLALWIEDEGMATGEAAVEAAEALAESPAMREHAAVLAATGEAPQALRDAAVGVACIASMDPAARAAEEHYHGHGEKPRRQGKRGKRNA